MTLKPCKCGSSPFEFPRIGKASVMPMAMDFPLDEFYKIPLWPSYRCVKCGRNSEPKASHDEAIEAWNKLNE